MAKNYLVITVCQEPFLLFLLNPSLQEAFKLLTHFTNERIEAQRIK